MHDLVPSATQGGLQTAHRREEDIEAPRFNFLDRAGVQIRQLGQPLLRHLLSHPHPPDTGPERFKQGRVLLGHASLRRIVGLTNTAQRGAF